MLFDLQQFSKAIICQNKKCGKEFIPRNKQQRKFCCEDCKKVFFRRNGYEKTKARFQQIQHAEVPLPKNLSEKDKKAVKLYTKNKWGLGRIARQLKESKTNVRRRLIFAGVYKPTPEQNTLAKKGTGKFSNVLRRERVIKRKEEWRHRVAVCLWNLRHGIEIKVTCKSEGWGSSSIWKYLKDKHRLLRWISSHSSNFENISNHRLVRILRHRIAVCLWNFYRHKIAVETFCHSKGWNPSLVWNYLHRSKAYKKLKVLRPAIVANALQYENGRKYDWRSKKYATETKFQDAIEQCLKDFSITYEREKKFPKNRSRIDFEINSSIHLECKIHTKSSVFLKVFGQALQSKAAKKEFWLVIPEDIKIHEDQLEILEQQQIHVFSETDLPEKLAGRGTARVQTKTTGIYGLCKCCGKKKALMSRSPGGDARSYCVDCEGEIKQRVFHSGQNRWIIPQVVSVN